MVYKINKQNNEIINGDGGFIGLTQDPNALLKWAVSGPEVVRVISEFESSIVTNTGTGMRDATEQHDQNRSAQQRFSSQVQNLVTTFKEMGNPFDNENTALMRLHTKDIMDQDSIDCLNKIRQKGERIF